MTSLDISSNSLADAEYSDESDEEEEIMETDFSGIIAIVNTIPNMGAISSVNLLKNDIGVAQAEDLVSILKAHPTLKSLCGNSGDETELDMSGKMNGAADAIILVPEIINNRALYVLNLAENDLGALVLPEAWTEDYESDDNEAYRHTDGREQSDNPGKPEGLIAIANAIPDMGAMTSLNLASNKLGVDGAKIIAVCLPKCT
jgi:hypothetical protein